MADRRLIVVERVDDALHTLGTRAMHPGDVVTVGRAAELPVGYTTDARISRLAVSVTCTDAGWVIESTNRNGVLIHPWGLPPRYAQRDETTAAPRVALRIVGSIVREHWVLLEDDTRLTSGRSAAPTTAPTAGPTAGPADGPTAAPTTAPTAGPTAGPADGSTAGPADGPNQAELEALRLLFPDLLEWPPVLAEWPPGIEHVASHLRITPETLMRHLEGVRTRASELGLPSDVTVADPEYVHLLVQSGWLRPDLFPSQ